MIILILLTIATFLSWTLIKNKYPRLIIGTLCTILLTLQTLMITFNLTDYYGMKETKHTTTENIYTAGEKDSPVNILIANEIGKKSDRYIMVFKDEENGNPKVHFQPSKKKEKISDNAKKFAKYHYIDEDTAYVKKTKIYKEYKNDFYRQLLSFGQDKILIKEKIDVYVPEKDWVVLNAEQMKKLKNSETTLTTEQKKKMKEQKMLQIKKYKSSHKYATEQDINEYLKNQQTEQAIKQIKAQIKE